MVAEGGTTLKSMAADGVGVAVRDVDETSGREDLSGGGVNSSPCFSRNTGSENSVSPPCSCFKISSTKLFFGSFVAASGDVRGVGTVSRSPKGNLETLTFGERGSGS
jgi:hypothetical protein